MQPQTPPLSLSDLPELPRRQVLALAALCGIHPEGALAQPAQKTLVVARGAQFKSLDPAKGFEENSTVLIPMAYSTLLRYAWLERPYRLEPDLLERMPEPDAGSRTWTFTLRKGVRFHDDPCFPAGKGRDLTTDDVLFSLRRFADARLNTTSWFLLDGMVTGLDGFRAATQTAAPAAAVESQAIAGFNRIDVQQFSIHLTRANALFLYALASPALSIVAPEAVRHYGDKFDIHPVGTGPFILKSTERKGTLRWVRNPSFHLRYPASGEPGDREAGLLAAAGRRLPFVDAVEMPLMEESQPRMLKFQRGELDLVGVDRANADKMIRREGSRLVPTAEFKDKFSVYQAPGLGALYVWINLKDPLLGRNKLLRQALARLFDARADIETLLGGRARPLGSLVPHAIAGSEDETGARPIAVDPAAAQQLLAQAGFPQGRGLPEFTISCGFSGIDWRNRFDFHRARLAAAGIRVKPQFTDLPTFINAMEGSNFQLAFYGWVADYPDAENFYQMLYSKNVPPGPNYASFAHADYDRAYEASRFLPNGPERLAHFKRMNDIVSDEVPLIPMFSQLSFGLRQNWVRNHKRNYMLPGLEFVDIDTDLRRKGV